MYFSRPSEPWGVISLIRRDTCSPGVFASTSALAADFWPAVAAGPGEPGTQMGRALFTPAFPEWALPAIWRAQNPS